MKNDDGWETLALMLRTCLSHTVVLASLLGTSMSRASDTADFERDIAPILTKRCLGCHSTGESKGELDLTSRAALLDGGESGPAVVPGKPDASLLLERVAKGEMPPKKKGKSQALAPADIASLREWIQSGAPWPEGRTLLPYEATTEKRAGLDWWSFRPIRRPPAPRVEARHRVRNPIDAFIIDRLESRGMSLSPPADKRTLIRRAYFDLLGLPPTPEAVERFLADDAPDAYERLIDRLLASPHYGERWARYWLDLVRFAETNGYERDAAKPFAWKYRDYVISALNADKPYDRFVVEQLAGDEIASRSAETVIATGFQRLGTWDDEPNDALEYKYERLEDLVHATSSTFLGLTVKCARCHDHKFDPIPQADYYRFASVFWAGFIEPRERKWMGGPTHEELGFEALGWTDRGREVPPLHRLHKGDPRRPREPVTPAALSLVRSIRPELTPPPPEARTTRRRLGLAEWIVDKRNPLTARVLVNRLWQHHFGQGLVRTPSNFGFKGAPPTHPELLDWLASELLRSGWRIKSLHRAMMLSSTYRMKSDSRRTDGIDYEEADYANELWWRANPRRLDAEALRDAMLAVSGQLDRRLGGPSFYPRIHSDALEGLSRKGASWGQSPLEDRCRRSVYIFTKRSLLVPLMTVFDFCDTTQPCAKRDVTTVAPQALALLNNHFVHERSRAFARRVAREAGKDPADQIELAWRLAFGRSPRTSEAAAALLHMRSQRAHYQRLLDAESGSRQGGEPADLPGLVLRLRADRGVTIDDAGRASRWEDLSDQHHDAVQEDESVRPRLVDAAVNGRPALRFDGRSSFLRLLGQVVRSDTYSVFVVANDLGAGSHRGIFSNWNGKAGNSVTSLFVGLTGTSTVRFSDDFANAGSVVNPSRHFLLTAINGKRDAVVYQGYDVLARKGAPLSRRRLTTPYVIGQQGNINGEYWHGDIAEILVYDRQLGPSEREIVWTELSGRYDLTPSPPDPKRLALESFCHVLLNTNEFVYVD